MKPGRVWAGMTFGALMLWWTVGFSIAETKHSPAHGLEHEMPKALLPKRMVLDLPQAAQEGLKLTMREHLEAIDAIVGALAREDFARAAILTNEELGFPKHHVAMQREQGATFPPEYHKLAMAHHQAAEAMGEMIPTKDLKRILPHLQQTIHACVKCHQVFRLQD
ncbi:MAG: hypothetical protein NPIRA06_17410 [Nitrospirales bacterium]|nr:MAG: hypothetical protein NPIRA06_17410 [Nitrospirales bacterium]